MTLNNINRIIQLLQIVIESHVDLVQRGFAQWSLNRWTCHHHKLEALPHSIGLNQQLRILGLSDNSQPQP